MTKTIDKRVITDTEIETVLKDAGVEVYPVFLQEVYKRLKIEDNPVLKRYVLTRLVLGLDSNYILTSDRSSQQEITIDSFHIYIETRSNRLRFIPIETAPPAYVPHRLAGNHTPTKDVL